MPACGRLSPCLAALLLWIASPPVAAQDSKPPKPAEEALTEAVQAETAATRRVMFTCPKDALLTVEFLNSEPGRPAVVRPAGGEPVTLQAQESGSGFRYGDGRRELRGKGREVIWTDLSGKPVVCTEQMPTPLGTEPKE
ncbi:MliC family protein [Methylobacterium segetis]|uniref:MliC family protein n=1 Tax=Methylobacterium segetis TaxID=2488750 RepID=UPI001FE00F9E|nr:MliC family protein [Methylobacterium segetis]